MGRALSLASCVLGLSGCLAGYTATPVGALMGPGWRNEDGSGTTWDGAEELPEEQFDALDSLDSWTSADLYLAAYGVSVVPPETELGIEHEEDEFELPFNAEDDFVVRWDETYRLTAGDSGLQVPDDIWLSWEPSLYELTFTDRRIPEDQRSIRIELELWAKHCQRFEEVGDRDHDDITSGFTEKVTISVRRRW